MDKKRKKNHGESLLRNNSMTLVCIPYFRSLLKGSQMHD